MNLTQRYTVDKNNIAHRLIDNEAVILNLETGVYYSLDAAGADIWELLCNNKSIGQVIEYLKETYDATEERLKKDTLKLLENLEKEQLIKKA